MKKQNNEKIFDYLLICTIIVSIIFHIYNVFKKRLIGDESGLIQGFDFSVILPHPPMVSIFHKLGFLITGINSVEFQRTISFLIGITIVILIYYISKNYYDKKIAKVSVFLTLVSFWAMFFMTSLDHDGTENLLFSALVLISWIKYKKSSWNSNLWMFLFSSTFIICLLSKVDFIMLLGIFFIDYVIGNYYTNKKTIFNIKKYFKIIIPYLIICIGTLILFLIFSPKNTSLFMSHSVTDKEISFIPNLNLIIYTLLYLTPLLLFIPISKIKKISLRKDCLLLLLIIIPLLSFYFTRPKSGELLAYERYLIKFLFIPLILLTSKLIYDILIKNIKKILLFTGIFLIIFNLIFIFYYPPQISHNPQEFISKTFENDFLFPITSNTGPFIQVSTYFMILMYIISFILMCYYILFNKKGIIYIFIILLSVSISYNIILSEQYTFKLNYVDYDKSIDYAVDYLRYNDYDKIYFNADSLPYYIFKIHNAYFNQGITGEDLIFKSNTKNKTITLRFGAYNTPINKDRIKGFTVILIHHLKYNQERIELLDKNCKIIKEYYTNEYKSLSIYQC